MQWLRTGESEFKLIVVPLHGRGNNPQSGEGEPCRVLAYDVPADRTQADGWKTTVADASMHKTHNFDVKRTRSGPEVFWIGGKEGVRQVFLLDGRWQSRPISGNGLDKGVGEIRGAASQVFAVLQPMHGNEVAIYHSNVGRTLLDDSLNQGHALVCQPLLGRGFPEIVAGWREKNAEGKVGIKMYVRDDAAGTESWKSLLIDDNQMACEDLAAADLDADRKPELIAAGRATHNVIIYWNKTEFGPAVSRDRPALPPLSDEEKAKAAERRKRSKGEGDGAAPDGK
jgi:hypothetical protein